MDWVERKAHQDEVLQKGRTQVWNRFQLELESATNSYNLHFKRGANAEACFYNGQGAVFVSWSPKSSENPLRERKVRVSRANDYSFIEATYEEGTDRKTIRLSFAIVGESQVCLTCDGKALSEELACQLLLEPLFFPAVSFIHVGSPAA